MRWGFAVLMVGVALLMNVGIQALTGGPGRYAPIFPVLILVTLYAGRGPAILHLVLSLLAIDYLWVPPVGRLWPFEHPGHALALLVLTLAALATVAVSDVARRSLANYRRTQADLDRARARLDVLHDAARLVEWEWDLASGRVQLSPSARSVFGNTWGDVGGGWPMAHPDDRARIEALVTGAVARGEDYAFTSRMIRPDTGETRWIETRAVVHRGADRRPEHVTGVTIDVTEKEQALETARITEQRFRLALEGGSIVAWACDAQRRYTWVYNPPGVMPPEDVIGRPVGGLLPHDVYEEYSAALDRVWRTGEGERLPISWTHKGTTRHYLASIEPARDAGGVLTGLVGASVDVTELRRAEAQVRLSEEKFAKAFWASPDGLSLSRVEDGLLYEVNPSYLAIMGLTREEAIGRTSLELGLYPDPADRERGVERLRREGRLRDFELRVRNRAGEDRVLRVSAEQVEVGGEAAMLTIHRDVTEQQRVDAALRDSEERLRLALEGAQIGMWVADPATGLTECTPFNYELFGFEPQASLPAEAWLEVVHPEDRPMVQAAWMSAAEHGTPFAIEYRILRADGTVRWIDSRARFHPSEAGVPARVLGISMDVTARRNAEEALREAGRSKDEFLATLAHELRNPLAPLRTAAYLLNSPALGDGARRDAQQMIERQVVHLTRLVDDLLEVSRITLGRIELVRERLSVAMVVEHAMEAARAAIEEGGHQLALELPEVPLWVDADLVRLSQVFTNLLTNAARYTPPHGRITVRVSAMGERDVVVSVRDTGIGIHPDMLGRVFEMFVQLPHADRARHGGLGIGLALSKRLVELHGGSIEARSQGEGRGSEFSVRLPRVEAPRDATYPAARPAANGAGRRILVVDDNVDAATSLAILLQLLGHEVSTVHSGHDALECLACESFHVVLLDLGMPMLNGYDVARLVRERLGARGPKLVALTGWGQSADRARSAEAGFDHHLVKPADPRVIAQVIESLAGTAGGR